MMSKLINNKKPTYSDVSTLHVKAKDLIIIKQAPKIVETQKENRSVFRKIFASSKNKIGIFPTIYINNATLILSEV